jgi:hypothetical protein
MLSVVEWPDGWGAGGPMNRAALLISPQGGRESPGKDHFWSGQKKGRLRRIEDAHGLSIQRN